MHISLFQHKEQIKRIIVAFALILGIASLMYTNSLVQKLEERELRQIDFFAKAQHYIFTSQGGGEISFLVNEIIERNDVIPVIQTDKDRKVLFYRNIPIPDRYSEEEVTIYLNEMVEEMGSTYDPIIIDVDGQGWVQYIFYSNSFLITQLRYYPIFQILVFGILGLFAYVIFSTSRKSEQNRVWAGMAKETAHQLGTPISSLMGWTDYLKASEQEMNHTVAEEIGKDVIRLEMIANRFSNIGSLPQLKEGDLLETVNKITSYLSNRISRKVEITINADEGSYKTQFNEPLMEWVFENLIKNAVDAMGGVGKIAINLYQGKKGGFVVTISDTGKGISRRKVNRIFDPGFTTKKRGWGLGLTLARRIVNEYHQGKIFVKKSDKTGTTFQIELPDRIY